MITRLWRSTPLLITTGDYLDGFYQGTRKALYENSGVYNNNNNNIDGFNMGKIFLYERTVGYYSSLVNINAYQLLLKLARRLPEK